MTWLVLILLSVLFSSTFNIIAKRILNYEKADGFIFAGVFQVVVGILAIPIMLLSGFEFTFSLESIGLLIAVMIVYSVASMLYYNGLKHIDISRMVIFSSTSIFWSILLGAIFLGESITINKIIGSLIIFVGIALVSMEGLKFKKLTKQELLILLSAFLISIGALLDNKAQSFGNPLSYIMLSFITTGLTVLVLNLGRREKLFEMLKLPNFLTSILFNGIFAVLSFWTLFEAYGQGAELSIAYPILQSQTVIIALMGILLLKEKGLVPNKIISGILVILAVIVMQS